MECIIVFRYLSNNRVDYVMHEDGDVWVFPHYDIAVEYGNNNDLFQSGQVDWQIVELEI